MVRREDATVMFPPDGRTYPCFGTDGDLHISEIWDSLEQWEKLGLPATCRASGQAMIRS